MVGAGACTACGSATRRGQKPLKFESKSPEFARNPGFFKGVEPKTSNFRHIKPASFIGAGTGVKLSLGGRPRPTPTLGGKPDEEDDLRSCGRRDHRSRHFVCPTTGAGALLQLRHRSRYPRRRRRRHHHWLGHRQPSGLLLGYDTDGPAPVACRRLLGPPAVCTTVTAISSAGAARTGSAVKHR